MKQAELCARFHKAIELIGARWSGAIIHVLIRRPARFAELRSAIPGITDRMLSERLRELDTEGVVVRHVRAASPLRVEYELSAKGRDLERAMAAIGSWAKHWLPTPGRKAPGRSRVTGTVAIRRGRASNVRQTRSRASNSRG